MVAPNEHYYNNSNKQQQMCCFLTMYRLKSFISIGIVITLLIGIGLLYVLVYSFIISSITAQVQPQFRTLLIAVFLSSSLLMIVSSLSGIYGLVRRKNKFVVVYALTMVIYMVTFLVLAIFTVRSPQYIESQCSSNIQVPGDFNSTTSAAQDLLCKTNCKCFFTNSQGYSDAQLLEFGLDNYSSNETSLPTNAQNCASWDNNTYSLTVQMAILQSFFNCSGWCQTSLNHYFLFTNINYGIPKTTCVQALSTFLENFGRIIQISSFTASGFLLIILSIIICLWLHPDRGLKYDSLEIFKNTLLFVDESKEQQVEMQ